MSRMMAPPTEPMKLAGAKRKSAAEEEVRGEQTPPGVHEDSR